MRSKFTRLAIAATVLLAPFGAAHAQLQPVVVAIMYPSAALKYVDTFRHVRPRLVKFGMADVGGASIFQARASVYGPLDGKQLTGVLRTIKLDRVVSEIDGPWQVIVTGDNRAAEAVVAPLYHCSKSRRMMVLLSNQGDRWIVLDRPPQIFVPLCEPVQ